MICLLFVLNAIFGTQATPHETDTPSPQLILYFDVNKTLIAVDKAGGKTAEDIVSAAIADRVKAVWDNALTTPISYTDYVEQYLLPNPDHSQQKKAEQKAQISKVLSVLREMKHPEYEKMQEVYERTIVSLHKQQTEVFPSFYKLISRLNEKKTPYRLVIRTFGCEASEVAQEINQQFGPNFLTDFRVLKQGKLEGDESDLYKLVTESDHHIVIRDDWKWWISHDKAAEYGKPFPINPQDSQHLSLFFDDNASIDPLNPRSNIVAPFDVSTQTPLAPSKAVEDNQLFPVDVLEAINDENYFIRLVDKALGIVKK